MFLSEMSYYTARDMRSRIIKTLRCLGWCANIKRSFYMSNKIHRFSLSFFRCICVTVLIGKAI